MRKLRFEHQVEFPVIRTAIDTAILEQFIQDLEFDANRKVIKYVAFKTPEERVVIAPDCNFGQPMMESSGYPAATLWLANQAERGFTKAAAYGVPESTVRAAVDYFDSILAFGHLAKAA